MTPLPLAALRLAPEIRDGLVQLGLKTVGDVMARPRAPLAARFGVELMLRLDQAMGRDEEPITPRLPVPPFSVEQGFPEPVLRDEDLTAVLARLTERLCDLLEKRGQGARKLLASFFRVDGTVNRLQIGTNRPLRDAARLHRLFTDKFAHTQWDNAFGFDRIRLAALETQSLSPAQKDLSSGEDGPEFAHLIDRLTARLGDTRVLRFIAQDSHVPEQASVTIPAASAQEFGSSSTSPLWGGRNAKRSGWGEQSTQDHQDSLTPPRPVRLFERPEPIDAIAEIPDGPPVRFRWRRVSHHVTRVEGPERIAMPWWHDGKKRALTRDYFRVETRDGARLWLYREGLYDGTVHPSWYLHGFLS